MSDMPIASTMPNLNYADTLTPDVEALIVERFTQAEWTSEQIADTDAVTHGAIAWAKIVIAKVPPSPTRTRVLNIIEHAQMLASSAIRNGGKF